MEVRLAFKQSFTKYKNTVVDICPHWGLNSRPSDYKTNALPLSYRGNKFKVKMSLRWYRKQWKSDFQSNKASQNTRPQLLTYAPTEDWTQTLQFTRLTLYHWAIETTSLNSKCHYVYVRNKASQTRNETKPEIQLLIYAPTEDWSQDLQFTRRVLYHWAIEARSLKLSYITLI